MSKKKKIRADSSPGHIGEQIFAALTHQEIAHLLDALLAALSPDIRDQVLDQLQPDTRQTVQHILSPPQAAGHPQTTQATPVSLAKLEQRWSQLWGEWYDTVEEAAQEEGKYLVQEEHWEPPYFDSSTFMEDLEKVAEKMRPLLQTAFRNNFPPDTSFAEALQDAESEISRAMPEWMEITEGFDVGEHLTACLLEWEWLMALEEEPDAFHFAQRIRTWEKEFSLVTLEESSFLDFFTRLSEADQQRIFAGLTEHKEIPLWKNCLEDIHSHWHALYMEYIHRYAPERYLDNLRATIPQQWQNGLPVIEDLLAKKDYQKGLAVIEETLDALLRFRRGDQPWSPETSLLFTLVYSPYGGDDSESQKTLLRYYQQTAQGLDQSQRVNALEIQRIAFDHSFDWEVMLKAFEEVPVRKETRQALFRSWRDHILQGSRPASWGFGETKARETWWLHWLIESIVEVEAQKGPSWFQDKVAQWLARLPEKQASSGEDYALRLLTQDLTEMSGERKDRYPKFYRFVVRPKELVTPDEASRQAYLKRYAPDDLWDRVMTYWKGHLHTWVPRPEMAQESEYTEHAQWMAALRELAPRAYEILLDQWRVEHRRRRNLWQAMEKMGLK